MNIYEITTTLKELASPGSFERSDQWHILAKTLAEAARKADRMLKKGERLIMVSFVGKVKR